MEEDKSELSKNCLMSGVWLKEYNEKLRQDEFNEVVKPVMEWLNKYGNPHNHIIITDIRAELASGEICYSTEEFLKD